MDVIDKEDFKKFEFKIIFVMDFPACNKPLVLAGGDSIPDIKTGTKPCVT